MYKTKIVAASSYLPQKKLTNADLEKTLDTSHEWIVTRTGIHERSIAQEHETSGYMAACCAKELLERVQKDVEMVIVATTTPDLIMPSTAVGVQREIGAHGAFAFDVQGVCAGFVYALSIADQFIKTGKVQTAMVIGSDVISRIVDWSDRQTAVLFGDGAGAVFLERSDDESGIIDTALFADGRKQDLLYAKEHIVMKGPELFRNAVDKLGSAVKAILERNNLSVRDIDWFVPHQANLRIISALAQKFEIPLDKFVITIAQQANTSAASIPLAFCSAIDDGRIKKGDLILMEAIGAGLVWGTALFRL